MPFVKPMGPKLFEVSAEDNDFEFLRSIPKKNSHDTEKSSPVSGIARVALQISFSRGGLV